MERLTPAQQELYDWIVEYININKYSPSIREMMIAMNLRSPAPIQSRLERIKTKGYIDWLEGQARTIQVLRKQKGLPIFGTITAGGLVEPFTDETEKLDISATLMQPNCFALKVVGDSMIEDLITEGDYVIMKSTAVANEGQIVAARVEGHGTTLKRIYFNGEEVTLKASNSNYEPIKVPLSAVEIQGTLFAVYRLGIR
ncbi:MAG: repressor LexA [Cyanobacterium sp. T60_A2020_053]|nr:repressor LexA [Cyanobacterium sp. T60_A2020_053]